MCDWLKNYLDFPENIAGELVVDAWWHHVKLCRIKRHAHFMLEGRAFCEYYRCHVRKYWNDHNHLPNGWHHFGKAIYFNPEIAKKADRYPA